MTQDNGNHAATPGPWIARALSGVGSVWNIGQLDKPTERALDKLVRKGRLIKSRARWCNISPLKSVWYAPKYDFATELRATQAEMLLARALDATRRASR